MTEPFVIMVIFVIVVISSFDNPETANPQPATIYNKCLIFNKYNRI